jgi:uncharacterized protein (TIGR03435 family)
MASTTLLRLVRLAYGVEAYQISGPSWMATEHYSLEATIPAAATKKDLPAMLRSTLSERFELAIHREMRELPVFALVVAKGGSKLVPTAIHEAGAGTMLLGPRERMIKSQITLAELILYLKAPSADPALSDRPVLDLTGLPGLFDITLKWSADVSPASDNALTDSDPLFVALQKQLGLKLETRKVPTEFVVIDHALRLPTPN